MAGIETMNMTTDTVGAPRLPIENFAYDSRKKKFVYIPTGAFWSRPAVDGAVAPVNVDGLVMRATEWLKAHRCLNQQASARML